MIHTLATLHAVYLIAVALAMAGQLIGYIYASIAAHLIFSIMQTLIA